MSDSSDSGNFFIVDDHDIKSITYATEDKWFQQLNVNQAYSGTITEGVAGAKASLEFRGTAVGVVGIATTVQNVGPPAVQFSIDGNVIQTTTAPNNGSDNFSFVYLAQDGLDGSSSHTLGINVLNATADYPFAMDYILYLPVQGATPTASQSVITTFLPAPSGTGASQDASSSKSSAPVGAIVGGVIGGLALIVATAIAIWFVCFRRRRSTGRPYFYATSAKPGDLLDETEAKPTPYEVSAASVAPSTYGPGSQYQAGPQSTYSSAPPQAPSSAYSAPSQYAPPSGLGYGSQSGYTPSEAPVSDYSSGSGASAPLVLASGSTPRASASPNQPRSKAAEAGLLSVPQEATFHADSGVRFDANGQPIPAASSSSSANVLVPTADLSDVPPSYTPA
ncbi:hypothetical protein L226DRAFT_542181 [Lentinus tigrinus ALCF2SS1-7]|uniref:Mid2 domain-containing protein n=1 Tax=Lentinus tigrinus ALCF2SS1-6 TaxID=1328759 RepID=A0A5C2SUI2_9APHY|nr:hypothetical protein L227DRAFT_605392 [Lentinus tigrinus ALCF2SS1-6]RPD80904.1 hypothetical protein L226DRAFT_542181 [Lentinus tigrinus ALCF2SS1-7]